jgi:S1-C subfamily serine protease/tetratricopeptide (TPR) repeat protein
LWPGAAPIKYEKIAGPITIIGDKEHYQILNNGQMLFEDHSWYYDFVAAFPDWNNPNLAVLQSSAGGSGTCDSYEVLDVKTGKKSESFGVCGPPIILSTKDEFVFAFNSKPSFVGFSYGANGLTKIPNLTPEQHIQNGIASYNAKNYRTAIRHFWLVYRDRFPESPYYLGLMAHLGNGLRQNYSLAMDYYKKAAELDYAPAYFRIGILHANGRGVPRNPQEAMQWYIKAANLGEAIAQFNVGLGFLTGNGIQKDPRQALFWMLVAVDRLIDQKIADDARKNIRIAEAQLDPKAISEIQFNAASWKPITLTRWTDPAELKTFVGKYAFDRIKGLKLFEVPEVQSRIRMLLGPNVVDLINQWETSSPAEEQTGWLVASGCHPHMCSEQWVVAINFSNYNMFVCFAEEDKPVKYAATGAKVIDLPLPPNNSSPCPNKEVALSVFQRLFSPPIQSAPPAPVSPKTLTPLVSTPSSKLASTGSGFLVNSEGNILTNEHVIDGCSSIQIRSNNGHHRAIVVASDQTNDLAIIQSEVGGLVPLPFRDGPGIRAGDGIILVGFPYSGILTSSPNVSIGAVSALAGIGDDTRFLQISAPVQPGNSGGPLLDSSGDVVGVVVATMNALAVLKITGSVPQNVNFAIKGSLAREFLDARRISYVTALPAAKMDTADVGEKGSRSTVLIECYQ